MRLQLKDVHHQSGTHVYVVDPWCVCVQVMGHTSEVFAAWDEEYGKLRRQLRIIAMRERDEVIQIGYRLGALWKLQERINTLKE